MISKNSFQCNNIESDGCSPVEFRGFKSPVTEKIMGRKIVWPIQMLIWSSSSSFWFYRTLWPSMVLDADVVLLLTAKWNINCHLDTDIVRLQIHINSLKISFWVYLFKSVRQILSNQENELWTSSQLYTVLTIYLIFFLTV